MFTVAPALLTGNTATATDPNFASVSLLLHGDGISGSTTLVDSSSTPKTVAVAGNVQLSAVSTKFGSGCIFQDGVNGTYFQAPSQAFGVANFTLEFWCNFSSFANGPTVLDNRVVTPAADLVLYNSAGSILSFYSAGLIRASSGSLSAGQYYHIALCRADGVSRFFVNGVQQGSNYNDVNNYNVGTLRFGANLNGQGSLSGRFDDIRITPGVARYTANFTPPVAAFPDA